jgi:alanine racemase
MSAEWVGEGDPPLPMREARLDLDALRSNLAILRRLVAPAKLLAVVKADAYGHGADELAPILAAAGADWLGVADIWEGLRLRQLGVYDVPMLAWLHGRGAWYFDAIVNDIDLGLSSVEQLEAAASVARDINDIAIVHLKLDTGLSRNGIPSDEWEAAFARAAELEAEGIVRVRGIFSHLSNTDPDEDAAQRARFDQALTLAAEAGLAPEVRHLAASQAAITTPSARYDLVRVGIALYGLTPDPSIDAAALGLRPVMELAASIAAVRRVPAGAGVSYGFTHRTERETTLVLVPLGYGDGVPRSASGRAEVAIRGRRYPIVGRIAMDQFVVDVGDDPVDVGDRVVLWGDPANGVPSADEWAEWAGTINYEIVTRVGPRVPRFPVES